MLPPPTVVLVVVTVVVVVVGLVVTVVPVHGQLRVTLCPTAFFKQSNASDAVVGSVPFGAQTHAGVQVSEWTAVLRMKRQSLAVGFAPDVTGWAHCWACAELES